MHTRPEDRLKVNLLIFGIIAAVVGLAFRILPKMHELTNNPNIKKQSQVQLHTDVPIGINSSIIKVADPFWRAFSLAVVLHPPGQVRATAPAGTAGKTASTAGSATQQKAPPVPADLELQGILSDTNSVAIVRVGDAVKYLKEGAWIDGTTQLARIQPGKIQITQHGDWSTITLGQTLVRGGPGPVIGAAEDRDAEPVANNKGQAD